METIAFETIQTAIDNVCNVTTEEELDAVSQTLFDAQPALAGFVVEFLEDMSDPAKDLGFMMALVLWKSFEANYPSMRTLTDEEVITQFEAQEPELEKLLSINDDMIDDLYKKETEGGQPEVLNYLVQELFSEEEGDVELSEDEDVHLFMLLKFYAGVLNGAARTLKH